MSIFRAVETGRLVIDEHAAPLIRAFMRTVAARLAFAWWHEQNRRSEVELRAEDVPAVGSPEARLVALETLHTIATSIAPDRWRILRAYANGVPVTEIARREGVPAATVPNRMRLARIDIVDTLQREAAKRR